MPLGVPLHAEHERGEPVQLGRPGLDRLDQAVLLPGHRLEPVAEQVDRLVVVGGHVMPAALVQDPRQHAARADPHLVQAEPGRRAVVPCVSHDVLHVLVQRAAAQHVQHLHAAADREQRHAEAQRARGDREIPRVPLRHRRLRLRVARRPVPARVDVRAAGHDQPVEPGNGRPRLVVVPARRQQHGAPAAAPHRVHVRPRQQRRPRVPQAPGCLVGVRGYANRRSHSSPLNRSTVPPLPQETLKNHNYSERMVVPGHRPYPPAGWPAHLRPPRLGVRLAMFRPVLAAIVHVAVLVVG